MKEINIAKIILMKRKEKGITQDQLASYIGVSKASVSKWETKQSYPDITILPKLATYFNITIDELMAYEPQMTKKEIKNIYLKISKDFTEKPFEEVVSYCRKIIKKYLSCDHLLYQIGVLFVNNKSLANSSDQAVELVLEAKGLFEKIRKESKNIELERQSIYMEAVCLITLGNPHDVINLLGASNSLVMSTEVLLASAYQMTGEFVEAKKTLQIEIYQYFFNLLQLLQSYLSLCDDEGNFDEVCKRILVIADVFKLEELHPTILLPFYLVISEKKLINENIEEAIEYLKGYVRIATSDIYPLKLRGDSFFDLIDEWFENLAIGTNPPRDEKIVKKNMLDNVINNSAFLVLEDNIHYINLIKKLKDNC